MDVSKIIKEITPLYNSYKANSLDLTPVERIELMWDSGDILKRYIEKENLVPNVLYRSIYGKSESKTNITQKSYISRDFQSRCYRIRNIFKSKADINKQLKDLKLFSAYLKAMPFFDNPKYKLTGKDKINLLDALNSNESKAKTYVENLLKTLVNKKNPRTQKLSELELEKKVFVEFYNYVSRLNHESVKSIIKKLEDDQITNEYIRITANNTNSLSQDGLKFYEYKDKVVTESVWKKYEEIIIKFSSQKTALSLRRFRRIIPVERIVRLSDLLFDILIKIEG